MTKQKGNNNSSTSSRRTSKKSLTPSRIAATTTKKSSKPKVLSRKASKNLVAEPNIKLLPEKMPKESSKSSPKSPSKLSNTFLNLTHRERMRQKLLKNPTSLYDYELLEIIFYYILPRRDTKGLAKDFLKYFGSIRDVIFAERSEQQQIMGIGSGSIVFLSAIRELFVRASRDSFKKDTIINSTSAVLNYYKNVFGGLKNEQLRAMFLNTKNAILADEILQEGTINQAALYPRNIIHKALQYGATAIILAHNHPSGDPTPSRQDIEVTKDLAETARRLNIILLDHVIIGGTTVWSMKANHLF